MKDTTKVFQLSFLGVFLISAIFIFISSYWVLNLDIPKTQLSVSFPKAPPTITIDQVDPKLDIKIQEEQIKLYKNKVDAYTQQVSAFAQEVSAYKTLLDNQKNIVAETQVYTQRIELYKLVIKDSLIPILTGLIAAIAAYIFAKTGLEMLRTYYSNKTNKSIAAGGA